MKFLLLDEGQEVHGYEVEMLPWEEMTDEQQKFTLEAWIPETKQ